MQYVITAFPIDRPFQEKLGIYDSCHVSKERVGELLTTLIEEGYTNVHTYFEEDKFSFHCSR